jgi:hypothetical protein
MESAGFINAEQRIVYKITSDAIYVAQLRCHFKNHFNTFIRCVTLLFSGAYPRIWKLANDIEKGPIALLSPFGWTWIRMVDNIPIINNYLEVNIERSRRGTKGNSRWIEVNGRWFLFHLSTIERLN